MSTKRPVFLPRPPQPDRTHGPGRIAPGELAKFLIFFWLFCGVARWTLGVERWAFSIIASLALSYVSLIAWNHWRMQRELRAQAFQDWMDRVAPIARQYKINLSDHPELWRRRWLGRLTPHEAVAQHNDALMMARQDWIHGA